MTQDKKQAKKQDNSNIEFFVLVETSRLDGRKTVRQRTIAHVPLNQKLSLSLSASFKAMAESFFDENRTVIPFDGRYTPGKGEAFVIEDFTIDSMIAAASKNPLGSAKLNLSRSPFPQIKAILMTEVNSPLRVLFQEFKTSQIIRQGRALFFDNDTYSEIDVTGIAIGDHIDAVYDDGKLWFRNYYTANRLLDLSVFFHDATNEEIKDLLKMDGIVAEDEALLLEHADAGMRRRFTIVKETEILSRVRPEAIQASALEHNLAIDIDRKTGDPRIVIPSDKFAAREVLDFLCEAVFFGSLTGLPYVANSFRPRGTKKAARTSSDGEIAPVKKVVKKKAVKKVAKKAK